jgi:hypothetical protein
MFRFFLVIILVCVCTPILAHADVFVWQDEHTKFTVSYPDRWGRVNDQKPQDVLTVLAPRSDDDAACRFRVESEGRYKIFPRMLAGAVQRTAVSRDFWERYVQEFDSATVDSVTDNGGLGAGFASIARVTYQSSVHGSGSQGRSALILAAVYDNKLYTAECSTALDAMDRWEAQFLSIIKSITFRSEYAAPHSGHYRPFLEDDPVVIAGPRADDWRTN